MKFTANRDVMMKAMARINSIVDARSPIPIIGNVKISAQKASGSVFLTGTDMDMEVVVRCDASIVSDGDATVPCRVLHDILRKLPDGAAVDVGVGDDAATLRSGRSRFKLSVLPAADFPEMTVGSLPTNFKLSATDLLGLIDRTAFAVSTEESRYYLNGIYLHQVRQEDVPVLRAVATDGHRLARADLPLPAGAGGMDGVILPRKLLGELARMLDGAGKTEVALAVSPTQIRIEIGDARVTSKLIDGTFPDYDRVTPSNFSEVIEIYSPEDLVDSVQRVSVISNDKSRRVALDASGGVMKISSSATDGGQSTDEIDIRYRGKGVSIGFNSAYLLDVVGQFKGSDLPLRMAVVNAEAPVVFTSEANTSALYVLMPMRG